MNARTAYLLLTPELFGTITPEQAAKDAGVRIYWCAKCSDKDSAVYHNLAGTHLHATAAELRDAVPSEGGMASVEVRRYTLH